MDQLKQDEKQKEIAEQMEVMAGNLSEELINGFSPEQQRTVLLIAQEMIQNDYRRKIDEAETHFCKIREALAIFNGDDTKNG